MEFEKDCSLKEWAKDKPLSILQLDPADRAVLRIAGSVLAPKRNEATSAIIQAYIEQVNTSLLIDLTKKSSMQPITPVMLTEYYSRPTAPPTRSPTLSYPTAHPVGSSV
ncbi:hypothetical protein EVAR_80664_1 [Eumeta japonica]|uniref:Uncharacterized protein n=1 Tax=Eumeta variegata TaxID=151549 RepID=A0A4C1U408_EUMVA|nr:hypothetical protein EVAR_80664_1 [Eumeta japonica]